jgi:uncharacterized protein with PQ loop repeat
MNALMGAWCTLTSLVFIWPQVWRMTRHDTSHGVSAFGVAHGLVGSGLWLSYGISMGRVAIWVSNIQFIAAQLIIVSVLYRHGKLPLSLLARFAAVLVVLLVVGIPAPAAAVGWLATVVGITSLFPQVLHTARTENLHGISVASWALTIMSSSSWMIYGWMLNDMVMATINYFTIPMMIYVMTKAIRWRLRVGEPIFAQSR